MKTLSQTLSVALCAVALLGLSACDASEDNLDFELGSTLTIVGSSSVAIPATAATATRGYYVQAFTRSRDYTWTYNGNTVTATCTGSNFPCLRVRSSAGDSYTGEFLDVSFAVPGTYTIGVSTGGYDGEKTVTVTKATS